MKLSQYKEKKNSKKIIIIISAILLFIGGIILEKTFANFKVQKSFKVMEGNFIYEGSGDVIFSFYNNGKNVSTIPKKEEGVSFLSSKCSNNASVKWYDNLWAPIVTNLTEQGTKCELYFGKSAVEYLIDLQKEKPSELAYDGKESLGEYGTDDNNLRFIGSNPNNYVEFNNETWRIIGVMNNIEDEYGSIGSHLKIIRDCIGIYSWDSSESSVDNGDGANEWSDSAIEKVLNENYYSKKAGGKCYEGSDNKEKSCPLWENIGLNDEARIMISKIKWNTGAITGTGAPYDMYKQERSLNDGLCTGIKRSYITLHLDSKIRTTEWMGYVGLMYPSDFLFAIGGESRLSCMQVDFNSSNGRDDCKENWIISNVSTGFTITPVCSYNNSNNQVASGSKVEKFSKYNHCLGIDNSRTVYEADSINPTVYLNSNVKIEEDTSEDYGSINNPFRLVSD